MEKQGGWRVGGAEQLLEKQVNKPKRNTHTHTVVR